MEIFLVLYTIILFYCLSPGILFRFPKKGKYLIALIHSILFAVLFHFVRKLIYSPEGFQTQGIDEECIYSSDCASNFCSSCVGSSCPDNTERGVCLKKKDSPVGSTCVTHSNCSSNFCSSCIGYDCSGNTKLGKCLIKKDVPDGDPCLNDTDCQSGWCSVCNGSPCKTLGAKEIRKPATGTCLKRTDMTYIKPGSVKSVNTFPMNTDNPNKCVFNSDCASLNCSAMENDNEGTVVCSADPKRIPTGFTKAIFDIWIGSNELYERNTGLPKYVPPNRPAGTGLSGLGTGSMRSGRPCQAVNTKFAYIKGFCMAVPRGFKCTSSFGCYTNYCKNNTCAAPDGLTDSPCLKNDDCKSKSCLNIGPKQNLGYQAYFTAKTNTYTFGFCK